MLSSGIIIVLAATVGALMVAKYHQDKNKCKDKGGGSGEQVRVGAGYCMAGNGRGDAWVGIFWITEVTQ